MVQRLKIAIDLLVRMFMNQGLKSIRTFEGHTILREGGVFQRTNDPIRIWAGHRRRDIDSSDTEEKHALKWLQIGPFHIQDKIQRLMQDDAVEDLSPDIPKIHLETRVGI